ncbi:hypothetical protein LTR62_000945 [Meristemomyces frigidus]|uniref:Rhodopsin domain-containing protein n=1 Tax=Meristemomyces frigidus TaxID=1508187 RepID=A0AAN7T8G2_9PEZI|nr:hypothetical protein LTR62_000945 [Meristemomyces frigidus]
MLLAIGMTTCFQMEVYYGLGLHTSQVKSAEHKRLSFLWLWINQILYKIANGSIKISIALLYLRIFPSKQFKYTIWAFCVFVVAYCLAAILPSIFQCRPVLTLPLYQCTLTDSSPIDKAWNKKLAGHCIKTIQIWYVNSTMTLIADAILIALPINNIIRLQLPKAQRLALVFVFSLGIFVMATTIVRLVSLNPLAGQGDTLWYQASSNSWAFLEIDVSLICASIPILRTPMGMLFPRLLGRLSTRNGGAESGRQYHGQASNRAELPAGSGINMANRAEWQKSSAGHAYVRGVRHPNHDDDDDDRDSAGASDEERILGSDGIRKTTMVTLDYDESQRSQSGTFGRR